ncbi:MAG TPA: ceramidase domain-containing protein [Verrucomicrobiae bacterium]|nr:ceramidase domain-containing protein [Verrucomicrobiae bacterium]
MNRTTSIGLLVALTVVAVTAVFLFPRIPQNPAFNHYADQRSWLGIPCTLDVLSNIPFVIAGLIGLFRLGKGSPPSVNKPLVIWTVLFTGIVLTGFGSAYYHWRPDNESLVWDRLPMTIVFTSFSASMIAERIDARTGRWLFGPLLILGLASVLFWHWGEQRGVGDLRLYGLIQFFPMAAIPVMAMLFPAVHTRNRDLWIVFSWYALAIAFQLADAPVYHLLRVVSGHTLKHLCAAIAAWQIVQMFTRPTATNPQPIDVPSIRYSAS